MSQLTQFLKEMISDIQEAKNWLQRSFDICHEIGIKAQYTPAEQDDFEALTSRFARMTDLIINKALRTIDRVVEFESSGTLIDVVNRAHKRGLIESPEQARILKDLRNQVSHEYAGSALIDIYHSVLNHTPTLLDVVHKTLSYAESLLQK